jgi:hypothetical protein
MPAPARSFRELIGVPASTASTSDSALVIIDAQNEYVPSPPRRRTAPQGQRRRPPSRRFVP